MKIKKYVTGFVIQTFDTEKGKWVSQEFVAGEPVEWEDENGRILDDPEDSPAYDDYLPFDMEQPE